MNHLQHDEAYLMNTTTTKMRGYERTADGPCGARPDQTVLRFFCCGGSV